MTKEILIAVAAGGLGTSAIEYFVGYNAIDWLKDHVVALFHLVFNGVAGAKNYLTSRAQVKIAKLQARL